MTTNMIHDMAEKWLPIPLPEYKDCPPTIQATLRDPRVIGAQRYIQMMVERETMAAAQPEPRPLIHRPKNRRKH